MVNFIPYNEVDATNLKATTLGWGATQAKFSRSTYILIYSLTALYATIQDGGFESTKLRQAAVGLQDSSVATCGDYAGLEFNRASMICTTKSTDGKN